MMHGNLGSMGHSLNDVSDTMRVSELRSQAARCRRLADAVLDRQTIDALTSMAREYEQEAQRLSLA